ncbi:MAG: amidohydrolase family protein [Anaerolineales bacterium]|nr:amidohydrolase family protein [Anaerolineales bacterium]
MNHASEPKVLLLNGNILTLDDRVPHAQSIAIQGERILAVGMDDEILNLSSQEATSIDLHGRTVIPALTDAHIHLKKLALSVEKIDCEVSSLSDCLERVRERALTTPAGDWILGHGWNQNLWERFGQAEDLDGVAPHHPVYLTAKSLHAGWANTLAMKQARIHPDMPDPKGGRIDRDQSGKPTGIFFEEAMKLISSAVPSPPAHQLAEGIAHIQEDLWRFGLSSVHDFDDELCLQALNILRDRNTLGLRVLKNIQKKDFEATRKLGLKTSSGDHWVRTGNLKLYADGALGPHTAAMIEAYDNKPQDTGMSLFDKEELLDLAMRAVDAGFALAIHAIGDRANREVLDVYEKLRNYEAEQKIPPMPHRIEHLQLLHPDDLHRPARLGIIASMQPLHATSDMTMADLHWGARSRFAYAWRSQLLAGAVLAFGSDAPVEPANPFLGLHAAVTRQRQNGEPSPDGWFPEERITLHDALLAYTQGPAIVAGWSSILGRLVPSYMADLIVLDADPYTCDNHALADIKPLATMVAGTWRFREF